MTAKRRSCPVHGRRLQPSKTSWGPQWRCPVQGCTVACWGGETSTPADEPTRRLRIACHNLFDVIWQGQHADWEMGLSKNKGSGKRRKDLYRWLARRMDIPSKDMHFGMLNFEECRHAIFILENRKMLMFDDGPAKGKLIISTRVPFLLRIAVDPDTGECTALDNLADKPRSWEKGYAYIMIQKLPDDTDDGSPCATYQLFEHQPDDMTFRIKEKWSAWCLDMARGPGRQVADNANIQLKIDGKPLPPMKKPVDEAPPHK